MQEINKRLVEVSEVLNHLDKKYYLTLPQEILNCIETNKDKNYTWNYDETLSLQNQDLHHDTICILSYLCMKYFYNDKQKEYFNQLHKQNYEEMEDIKREKFQINFDKKKHIIEDAQEEQIDYIEENSNTEMIVYKESPFIKLKHFFKNLFGKLLNKE